MSGKSTFLRTVGVNVVLAQTINTCLADRYDAPIYHVRSCIGRADDLLAGKSYYLVEVESVLDLVRASAVLRLISSFSTRSSGERMRSKGSPPPRLYSARLSVTGSRMS